MNRLINLGFQHVGRWSLVGEDLEFILDAHENASELIYCFIVNSVPLYFGITQGALRNRMSQYQNPHNTQSTNIRIKNNLIDALRNGQPTIEIFVFIDGGLLSYGGFRVNLAMGLEPTLIEKYDNLWNIRGNRRAIITEVLEQLVEENNIELELDVDNLVEIPLNIVAAAILQGFVNIPAEFGRYFGNNLDAIIVRFDNTDYAGRIYRNHTTNSVRVYVGVELRNWMTNNFHVGEIINSSLLDNRLTL